MTKHLLFFLSVSLFLNGCGANSSSTQAPSLSGSLTIATANISKTADIIGGTRRQNFSQALSRAALSSVWTTANGVYALANGGSETLQSWMEHMFDPDFVNSNDAKVTFAGRIANELGVLCFIANAGLTTDSTGLPADGTHQVELTALMAATCGVGTREEGGVAIGTIITLNVSTLSDTTIFNKLFTATVPGGEDCPFKFQAKVSATDINIAAGEDQSCDDRNQASGSVFRYNSATQISRFTYISQNFDSGSQGFEFYRGMLNEASDEAYVLGIYGGQTNGELSQYVSFTAAGKPAGGTSAAVSVRSLGNTITNGDYNGCVNTSTSAVGSTDTLACDVTGTAIGDAFSVITNSKSANDAIDDIYGIGATTDLRFEDESDIYTY